MHPENHRKSHASRLSKINIAIGSHQYIDSAALAPLTHRKPTIGSWFNHSRQSTKIAAWQVTQVLWT
jgi:hypothetical protein